MDIIPDTVDAAGFAADSVATILYHDDVPVNHVPVAVLGDGNCLYRQLVLLYLERRMSTRISGQMRSKNC